MVSNPQTNWFVVSLFSLLTLFVCYFIFRLYREFNFGRAENDELLSSFIRKKKVFEYERTVADSFKTEDVDKIMMMQDTGAKGDALEDLTADLFKALGYKTAKTIRQMKASGEIQVSGVDQGGDVFVEGLVKDKSGEREERIIVQCKAYKTIDEERSNSAVQQTIAAKAYYESILGKTIHRMMMITTAYDITKPAQDLADKTGVEIITNGKLKELIKKANYRMYLRALQT
jgi:HJR/Mrr/RecB family endonuclease